MVQHTSVSNGKNSHIRKKMHQSLPEHLQIKTQRIQKIRKKQKNIRLSQHPPQRLSHPKTNKKPLRASREDQRKQPNLRLLIPKRRILQKHSVNRLHPPEAFLYLDERNYLQNNVPVIYHMQRKIGMKSIQYEENLDGRTADTRWRYNMALPQKDTEDKHRKNTKKYWWIRNP